MSHEAVVIGTSAGGMEALKVVLPALPASLLLRIAIVQHRDERSDSYFTDCLNRICEIPVTEAEDKEPFSPGHIFMAPAGYHLLIEPDCSFSLSIDPRVNHARPSIDVLFESAAEVFGAALIGIVLTGANADGAMGLKTITERGGLAIVQNPENAVAGAMPRAALAATQAHHVADLEQIAPLLMGLCATGEAAYGTNG